MGTRAQQESSFTRSEVYLPRIQLSALQTVSDVVPTMITVAPESASNLTDEQRSHLSLEVQPGTALDFNGNPIANLQVGISTVPPELVRDMLPPGLMQHTFDITIQAPGASTFDTPLTMTFPNVFHAAPGTKLNFLSFDHTTGRLVIEGTATVSADGLSATTDPGQGITKPGWHGLTPPLYQMNTSINSSGGPAPEEPSQPPTPPIPPNEPGDVTYEAGIAAAGDITSIVKAKFGFQLPTRFFTSAVGGPAFQPFLWEPSVKVPENGVSFTVVESSQFSVPDYLSYFVPTFNASFPDVEVNGGIQATLQAQVKVIGKGLQHSLEIKGTIKAAVELIASLKISDSFLASLPYGIGNFITKEREIDQLLQGLTLTIDVEIPNFFSTVPLMDFEETIGPIAQVFVGVSSSVSSIVFVDQIPTPASAERPIPSLNAMATSLTDVNSVPTFVDSYGINDDPRSYYRIVYADGFQLAGLTDSSGNFSVSATPNSTYTLFVYSPRTNRYSISTGTTGSSGQTGSQSIVVGRRAGFDSDGDGLPDIGEFVIGTDPNKWSSTDDGISDGAKLSGGLDPLAGLTFPTGIVASLPLEGTSNAVEVEGSTSTSGGQTAYVATGSYGLAIIDVSKPQQPNVLSQLDLSGEATDVSVDPQSGIAVVATNSGGLDFVNISDGKSPTLIRTLNESASQVEIVDGIVYATVGSELRSYALLTGERLQSLAPDVANIVGLAQEGGTLYTTDSNNILRAIDTSIAKMSVRGSLALPASGGKLFVGGGVAYIGAGAGFVTVDISDPNHLVLISGVDAANIEGRAVVANGSGIAIGVGSVTGPTGPIHAVDVLNVSDPSLTGQFITRFNLPAAPQSVAIAGGVAFVADGDGGLIVVNYVPFDRLGQVPTVSIATDAIDADPTKPGVQVVEETTISVIPTVADDVQVRNVELLVNGQVVGNDVSFPFNLDAIMPTLASGATTATLQVRATDTGGNAALSTVTTVELVKDQTAPVLLDVSPSDGAFQLAGLNSIHLQFNEPVDPATINASTVRVRFEGSNQDLPINAIQLRARSTEAIVTFDFPTLGEYTVTVDRNAITDRAGNAVGGGSQTLSLSVVNDSDPGDSANAAFNVGQLGTLPFLYNDRVGKDILQEPDPADVFRFTLATDALTTLSLSGQERLIFAEIFVDANHDGQFQDSERIEGRSSSTATSIIEPLSAGDYFVRLSPHFAGEDSAYFLNLSASSIPDDDGQNDPGDTIATARNLGVLSPTEVDLVDTIHNFDTDVYRFTVTNDSVVTGVFTGLSEYTYIELYTLGNNDGVFDSSERLEGYSASTNQTLVEPLSAGTYFIRVSAYFSDSNTSYSMSLSENPIPGDDGQNDPGDTIATARDLGVLSPTEVGAVDTIYNFDTDVYRFTVTNDSIVTGVFSGLTEYASVELFTLGNNNGVFDSNERLEGFSPSNSLTLSEPLSAGTYLIRVSAYFSDSNTAYSMSLSENPIPGDDGQNDPGDTSVSARNLGVLSAAPINVVDTIHKFDTDVFRFTLTTNSIVTGVFDDLTELTEIELYAIGNDDGVLDGNERLDSFSSSSSLNLVKPLVAGTYFLRVSSYFPDSNTAYSLGLSAEASLTHLLHFYGFDGNSNDEVGTANGILNGGVGLTTGYQGQAYNFDGADDYVSIDVDINPTLYPWLTMGAWVQTDSLSPQTVMSHDNVDFDRSIVIDTRGGGGIKWSAFAGTSQVLAGAPVVTGTWVFLAVVYNQASQTTTIYVDGQSFTKTNSVLGTGNPFVNIGRNPGFKTFFDGTIDNVFIYEGALSASEIDAIRQGGASYLRTQA
jgi:hypothetical protein